MPVAGSNTAGNIDVSSGILHQKVTFIIWLGINSDTQGPILSNWIKT